MGSTKGAEKGERNTEYTLNHGTVSNTYNNRAIIHLLSM